MKKSNIIGSEKYGSFFQLWDDTLMCCTMLKNGHMETDEEDGSPSWCEVISYEPYDNVTDLRNSLGRWDDDQ